MSSVLGCPPDALSPGQPGPSFSPRERPPWTRLTRTTLNLLLLLHRPHSLRHPSTFRILTCERPVVPEQRSEPLVHHLHLDPKPLQLFVVPLPDLRHPR